MKCLPQYMVSMGDFLSCPDSVLKKLKKIRQKILQSLLQRSTSPSFVRCCHRCREIGSLLSRVHLHIASSLSQDILVLSFETRDSQRCITSCISFTFKDVF